MTLLIDATDAIDAINRSGRDEFKWEKRIVIRGFLGGERNNEWVPPSLDKTGGLPQPPFYFLFSL